MSLEIVKKAKEVREQAGQLIDEMFQTIQRLTSEKAHLELQHKMLKDRIKELEKE